ncbi:E3 ubiquitin-protein ligase synoviolin A-like [Penaeus indicus]|uniref:E3 ubiquitin-protein ligase synoviolin A-like n=1 Tax=Penaeus indicus TaxID=29960 RepID=UPI00300C0A45
MLKSNQAPFPGSTGQTGGAIPSAPFNMLPPLFPLLPFNIPPPPPPLNFAAMTEDEVRQLEGNERQHVEARIKVLRNIQTLLDAAVVQMNQYASVVASLDSQSIPRNVAPQQAGATETASEPEPSSSEAAEPMVAASVASNDEAARSEVTSSTSAAASPSSSSSTTTTPASADTSTPDDMHPDSPQEIRRRRLERFTQNT